MPTTQHTSPQFKMKRYSHGNQATGGHGNHSVPPGISWSDKDNWSRRDDNLSHNYLHACNQVSTPQSSNTNSDVSNNNTQLFTINSTHSNNTNPSVGLTVDTSQYANDVHAQTISSPHSAEVIQQPEYIENYSYPLSDLVYARTHQDSSHSLHHSLSDSVIPMGTHHFSNEPFHIVPQNSENVELPPVNKVEETAEKLSSLSLTDQDYTSSNSSDVNISRKWPSTELYHDSDENDFNDSMHNNLAEDHSSAATVGSDGQVVDNDDNSIVTVDTNNNSLIELGVIDNDDIDFLKSCFPNILADQVSTVYNNCEQNIETAVGKLLLLPTSSVAKVVEDFNDVSQNNEEVRKLFQEESSAQAVDDIKEVILTEDIQTTSMDEDEKVARALQDQLDKAFMEENSGSVAAGKALQSQNELCSANHPSMQEDEGLILRLPPPLANKLQDMFGSVKEYLITDGEF